MRYNRLFTRFLIGIFLILTMVCGNYGYSLASGSLDHQPIVIIAADKMDSLDLLNCKLPSVKRFLETGACGLMNIRSGAGYTDTASGYLTLGAGSRCIAPETLGGVFTFSQTLPGGTAQSYLNWTFGADMIATPDRTGDLIVPDIGRIRNQAATEDRIVIPGSLGTVFHEGDWSICLISDTDNATIPCRPGGLLLMDRQGVIPEGNISDTVNQQDANFPYLYRFSVSKMMQELPMRLAEKKMIVVEFSDFYRLDDYQNQMLPDQFQSAQQETWINFDRALEEILKLQRTKKFSLILISPSVSKESVKSKNILGPVVINNPEYQQGLLASGTTKWPGLIANIDFLPTVVKMAGIHTNTRFSGKVISFKPVSGSVKKLTDLNQRLIASNANQRRTLDWYMGIISFCWIGGLLLAYLKKSIFGEWLVTGVMVIPLTLIALPLFPLWCWQLSGFIGLTLILTIACLQIKALDKRIMILAGVIWGALIIDQLLGWHLIRFSALGYSAMAGSRYYGLGNEFMGVFLAVSLIFAHLTQKEFSWKWIPPIILGISILIFCLPQLGAKFGGILVGSVGFPFYLIKLYNIKLRNKKLWFGLGLFVLILVVIGWWDSARPPEMQTHIGQFVRLLFNKDYQQLQQIILRKIAMNLKLTVFSPWMRIIMLALTLGIINRLVTKQKLVKPAELLVWQALLVTGIAAYLFNDSGILAFATCLAFGFSVMLLKWINSGSCLAERKL